MTLNSAQITSAGHGEGPALVLAGPGSGKTAVIIRRIQNLIENQIAAPSEILAVTFSRAAAEEMSLRFKALRCAGDEGHQISGAHAGVSSPVFATFHSIFWNILKLSGGRGLSIITEHKKFEMLKTIAGEQGVDYRDETEFFNALSNSIGRLKSSGSIPAEAVPDPLDRGGFIRFFRRYESEKKAQGLADFDDILLDCYNLLSTNNDVLEYWRGRFKFILVDEFQDINDIQYRCIKLLAAPLNNLFVVGDDDQSIYAFRGSSPGIMRRFSDDFKGAAQIRLDINYRSTAEIINAAAKVISANHDRISKRMIPAGGPTGSLIGRSDRKTRGKARAGTVREGSVRIMEYSDKKEESEAIAGELYERFSKGGDISDTAVLFRNNADCTVLVRELEKRCVPYTLTGRVQDIFTHFIFKDILSYMKIAAQKADKNDYMRIINRPVRYISHNSLNYISHADPVSSMKNFYHGNRRMLQTVNDFEQDIKNLEGLSPFAAFKYIVNVIDYKQSLIELSLESRTAFDTYEDILWQIQEICRESGSLKELIERSVSESEPFRRQKGSARADDGSADPGVRIMTMHSCKGLEFDTVYIPDVNSNLIPSPRNKGKTGEEEERRLFYVAMTRAASQLNISYTLTQRSKSSSPSQFIEGLIPVR